MPTLDLSRTARFTILGGTLLAFALLAYAGNAYLWDTTIDAVSVNGAADTANPGTTCLKVSSTLPSACAGNYIAIRNNNKELIAAALAAKASGSRVML